MRRPDLGCVDICRGVESGSVAGIFVSAKTYFVRDIAVIKNDGNLQANMKEQKEDGGTIAGAVARLLIERKHDDLQRE